MEGMASGDELVLSANLNKKREKTGGREAGTPNKQARFDLAMSAKVYGLRALATIVEIMEDEDENASNRFNAAKEILDRGFGKARQITEITGLDGEEIQQRLTIQFVGQVPVQANVQAQLTDIENKTIDMTLNTVRVPEFRRPWDKP